MRLLDAKQVPFGQKVFNLREESTQYFYSLFAKVNSKVVK